MLNIFWIGNAAHVLTAAAASFYMFFTLSILLQVELGFGNGLVEDLFFVSGYDIRGYVVAQVISLSLLLLDSKQLLLLP